MAGTIFGLGLSQRVNSNGKPDSGWKLYPYEANSSTPVTAYKDTALTAGLEHPWPIEADSSGMMPQFWLADGSYRVRATSSDGSRTFFDQPSVLAIGASSGAAPSGGVDPNAIFQTGDVIWVPISGARAGWVRENGRTIGSATSGASERANSDCQALFEFLWNNYSDSLCPVSTGRGANASADWLANKTITLLDLRGRSPVGLDDMGNSAASRISSATFTTGDELTPASVGGEAVHTLLTAEMPSHTHTASVTDPGHTHTVALQSNLSGSPSGGVTQSGGSTSTSSATTGVTVSNANTGGGGAHNNMQPFMTGTWYRRL